MTVLVRRNLARGAAVGAAVALSALCAAGAAQALGEVSASPEAVIPGGNVTVEGRCPDSVTGDAYVRATVGVDSIGRYVVVPVEDGEFSAKFRARAVGGYDDPQPGDKLRAQVSCATSASFVATVGTVKVEVVESVLDAPPTTKAVAASRAKVTSAASPSEGSSSPVAPWIPVTAFAIAAFGTAGAYALSRRNENRAAAMTGHPAQRGLGRPPRRDAK